MTQEILIGCDPEVFIFDGPYPISAHDIIPGTKEKPYAVDKGSIQVDGLAAEFNIEPAKTPMEFDKRITIVLEQLREKIWEKSKDLTIAFLPFVRFKPGYYNSLPEPVKELGCVPDYNFEGKQKKIDPNLKNLPLRTASGHIHVGFTQDQDPFDPEHFNTAMILSQGASILEYMKPVTLLEQQRVKYYGGDGAFRPKPYGVELRTPSNRWVKNSIDRVKIFNSTHTRMGHVLKALEK